MSKVLRTGKAGRSWAMAVLLRIQKVSLLHPSASPVPVASWRYPHFLPLEEQTATFG